MDFKLGKSLKDNLEAHLAELKMQQELIQDRISEIESYLGKSDTPSADTAQSPSTKETANTSTTEFDYLSQTDMIIRSLEALGEATSGQIADYISGRTRRFNFDRVKQFTSFNIYRLHQEGKLDRRKKDGKSYTYWLSNNSKK